MSVMEIYRQLTMTLAQPNHLEYQRNLVRRAPPQHGKAMTQNGLAKQLKAFNVEPKLVRFEDGPKRGYQRETFEPLWKRLCH